MASKSLEVKVKINTRSAEASLNRLSRKLNNVQKTLNKAANANKLTTSLNKALNAANKVNTTVKKINKSNKDAVTSAKKLENAYRSGNSAAGGLLRTVRSIASTYLGIMGARAVLNTSDIITSAENRLNNLEGGNSQLTQQSLDKIYAASQRSRSGYSDMLGNVSKSMTLAGDAFQNNIDNAIRFQEIMSKSYTIGGASAQEASSSMYQLVQALGSGVLQGDELRSLREGAPIAYKEIEKFAQGVFNTEMSLKDMASQGMITSDIVVAAIMSAEEKINASFENTSMTFAQAWEKIKNTAIKAFEPVLQMLNDALNSDAGQAIVNGIGNALVWVADAILWIADKLKTFFDWWAENWDWIKYIVITVLTILVAYLIYYTATHVAQALVRIGLWMAENWQMLLILITIGLLVAGIVWLANNTANGCEFMISALLLVSLAIVLIGIIMGSTALVVVGIIVMLVALFIMFAEEIVGCIYGIGAVFEAIWTNIKLAFQNILLSMKYFFWKWVDSLIQEFRPFLEMINAALSAMDKKTINLDFAAERANALSEEIGFVSVGDAWRTGYANGAAVGQGIQDKVGAFGDKIRNGISGIGGGLSGLGGGLGGMTIDPYDPAYALGGAYDPSGANDDINKGLNSLGNIDDNTGSIADSMELTAEDLAYLRKVAEMEWKKEFTTASITVDMSNYNNINSETDLDGIVTKLADKLYEEMNVVANGVYA